MTTLFDPLASAPLVLKNRIALSPMTRTRADDDGRPGPLVAEYYAQRAEAGLLISEGVAISPQGRGFPNIPGLYSAEQTEAWRPVVQRVQAAGARFFAQLWHTGRAAHPDNLGAGRVPLAPSALHHERTIVTRKGMQPVPPPRALTLDEVGQTITDYAQAARNAIAAGFDGVEVHAANGYLPSQFLHQSANRRTDRYGGDIAGRCRFLGEVVQACVDAVGAGKVAVRLTPFCTFNGCSSPDEPALYTRLFEQLRAWRLAYVAVVRADVAGHFSVAPPPGQSVPDVIGFVRPIWNGTLVASGDFDLALATSMLADGQVDVVAFGRDFIANPDLPSRLRAGHALAPRQPDLWYGTDERGYTDYPRWSAPTAMSV